MKLLRWVRCYPHRPTSWETFVIPSPHRVLIQVAKLMSDLFSSLFLCDEHMYSGLQTSKVQKFLIHLTFKFGHFFCTRVSLLNNNQRTQSKRMKPNRVSTASKHNMTFTWIFTHYSLAVRNMFNPTGTKSKKLGIFDEYSKIPLSQDTRRFQFQWVTRLFY